MAFEGRKDMSEGLDPSMTTRYYSRLRAVQLLLSLLNKAESPRITSVLAGGMEGLSTRTTWTYVTRATGLSGTPRCIPPPWARWCSSVLHAKTRA
jgi:hypothetical protein